MNSYNLHAIIRAISLTLTFCIFFSSFISAQNVSVYEECTKNWNTIGPPNGVLMIIGGAGSPENYAQFVALTGDPNELIVLIPTAGSNFDKSSEAYNTLKKAGATNICILHTQDPKVADSEAFVAPLRKAKAVFISGGFQSRLAESYLNTLTHREIFKVLDRGGVVAGTSAGASIQGSYLYGGIAQSKTPQYEGFGLIKNSVIGQHYIRRNRMGSINKILKNNAQLWGVGIDEATSIIVKGNNLVVSGSGKIAVYDPDFMTGNKGVIQQYLYDGDAYDLMSREVVSRQFDVDDIQWEPQNSNQLELEKSKRIKNGEGRLMAYGSEGVEKNDLMDFYNSLSDDQDTIVVLSTGDESQRQKNQEIVDVLFSLGDKEVFFLHTVNQAEANYNPFSDVLERAHAVWISDSPAWRLIDTYLNTTIHRKLFNLLNRDGVIAGNGRGAATMASRLYGEPEKYRWHQGFGFLENSMLINEKVTPKKARELEGILKEKPGLLALQFGENSKVVFRKDSLENKAEEIILLYKGGMDKATIIQSDSSIFFK